MDYGKIDGFQIMDYGKMGGFQNFHKTHVCIVTKHKFEYVQILFCSYKKFRSDEF